MANKHQPDTLKAAALVLKKNWTVMAAAVKFGLHPSTVHRAVAKAKK